MNSKLKKSLSIDHIRKIRKAAYWQKEYDEWKKYAESNSGYSHLEISDMCQKFLSSKFLPQLCKKFLDKKLFRIM